MAQSKIEWTDYSWNPVTGCTKISSGCQNCYAEKMAKRLHKMGNERYKNEFDVTLHNDLLELPKQWKKPKVVFVNSMSDLFHENIPMSFILKVFKTMNECPHHTFQVLTKRSERLLLEFKKLTWTHNIWMGVTVEEMRFINRINDLQKTHARVKFISFEPLLSPIDSIPLNNIDWVIVGGESGYKSRPMKEEWAISIRDQCVKNSIPYFFKQWGGFNKHKNGNLLQGQIWDQRPII